MSFKHLQQEACDAALRAYIDGKTCKEAAALHGISIATVRRCAIEAGVMRDRFAAMRLAAARWQSGQQRLEQSRFLHERRTRASS